MKNAKESSFITKELTAIKRVIKTLDGLSPDQKQRVMTYVSAALHEERVKMGAGIFDKAALVGESPVV